MISVVQYQPSSEQRALAIAFEDSLVPLLPVSRLREGNSESAATWSALEQLGLFGMAVAEEANGLGLGAVEEALVVHCLGRCLAAPGILATLGAAHARPATNRRVMATFDRDGICQVKDPASTAMLVRREEAAIIYAEGRIGHPIDSQWVADLVEVAELGDEIGAIDQAGLLRLRLIDAAALAGLSQATLMMAVDYAKMREQFGRPIGSFQAVKHHCANMAIASRSATDLVTFAAVAIDEGRADAAVQVESAFVMAATAAIDNASKNIQIHGAIGFSEEADPHLYLKRTQLLVAIGGGVEASIERLSVLGASDGRLALDGETSKERPCR